MEFFEFLPAFFPNNCYVCRTIENLKRCSRCKMISYCCQDHQKQHWVLHKDLCRVIASMMQERKVSHLFENLRGVDEATWNLERGLIMIILESKLRRSLSVIEIQMFRYPRSCFVCHDSRQELLKNCPGCPNASFCNEHESSSLHDKDCSKIKECDDFQNKTYQYQSKTLTVAIETFVNGTQVCESSQLPTSSQEYLDQLKLPVKFQEELKQYTLWYFAKPLTIFHALQKMNYSPFSKLIIHVEDEIVPTNLLGYWEVLLHLLPKLKVLRIVLLRHDKDSTKPLELCKQCCSRKKKLIIEYLSIDYFQYIKNGLYKEANLVAFYSWSPQGLHEIFWEFKLKMLTVVTCPMIFVVKMNYGLLLSERIRSSLSNFLICYSGKNDFKPLRFIRDWETGGICYVNDFLIILKPLSGGNSKQDVLCKKSLEKPMLGIDDAEKFAKSKNEPKSTENVECQVI